MKESRSVAPRRAIAQVNRARILNVAARELARNPDASMEDIARAVGVVRRTVYGHFANREALIAGLADVAMRDLAEAVERSVVEDDLPERALARLILSEWEIGDRWRLLIVLAERTLPGQGIRDILADARALAAMLIERGQRAGVFAAHLPAQALASALEGMGMALLQSVNDGTWTEPNTGEHAAVAALVALGMDVNRAATVVTAARCGAENAGSSGSAESRRTESDKEPAG
ncbi:transcriptional regulator, TetR family [Parafrankia sp. EAN1pec]|uniref:TetR/AcrR family transcriptional regulator n=1 Tax=Parafrankia sp. (strain EAN1pec) TaxID=298653 RepID=UPI00005413EA|nr:transcriptional regulator, TetR family [Frankia sp. EAN1pec]